MTLIIWSFFYKNNSREKFSLLCQSVFSCLFSWSRPPRAEHRLLVAVALRQELELAQERRDKVDRHMDKVARADSLEVV